MTVLDRFRRVCVTRHALARYRERVDPGATAAEVEALVLSAELFETPRGLRARAGWLLFALGPPPRPRGSAVALVTVIVEARRPSPCAPN